MKMDWPPEVNKDKSSQKEKNIEQIKTDFSSWVDVYLNDFYKEEKARDLASWYDPVETKMNSLVGEDYATEERKELTIIFAKKLMMFCDSLVFSDNFNEDKTKKFYNNLHNTFFNRSPNIFENLNTDFLQKVIISSKINETYGLRNFVDISGEMAYHLSFHSEGTIRNLAEDIKKLTGAEKISAIKQLALSAMTAYGNGLWAYPAFKGIIKIIEKSIEAEDKPIISFVLEYELKKIKDYSHSLDDFENTGDTEEHHNEPLDKNELRNKILKENNAFFENNQTVLNSDDVRYTDVSKDYGCLVIPSTFMPFALIEKEKCIKNSSKEVFSLEELKNISNFTETIIQREKDDQYYIDIGNVIQYLNSKEIDLKSIVDKDTILIFSKLFDYLLSKTERDNFAETNKLFDYVDENFENIFIDKLKEKGGLWKEYRDRGYNDGLFDMISDIATVFEYSKEAKDNTHIKNVFDKFNKLKTYHSNRFLEEERTIKNLTEEFSSKYKNEIDDIIKLSAKIDVLELKNLLDNLIKNDNRPGNIVPVRSYDGITKEKEFNPLGDANFSYLVKILHSPEIRNYINDRLKIKIEDLLLREQIHLLQFLCNSDEVKFNRIQKVLDGKKENQNIDFLRSFLSLSGDIKMGDKILALGEKLPEEVARKVFEKYGEIIDNVNNITDFAKNNFTKEIETNPELIKKIESTLYERGKFLLSDMYNEIFDKNEINYKEAEKDLERINANTIATLAIFKQAVKNGEILPVESIEGALFAKEEARDIEESSQKEMSELYDKNYRDYKDQKFFSKVKDYFSTAFIPESNKGKNYFYTFKKDNHIRAFVRFEKQEDSSLYASALNVDDASKNFGLGEAMMDEALSREAKENILHATCLTDRPSNMRYFEKGFISKGLEKNENTTQFKLVWDEKRNKEIKAKQMADKELIELYKNKERTDLFQIKEADSLEELHKEFQEGESLVRCFFNKEKNKWYAVYEKVSDSYGLNGKEEE